MFITQKLDMIAKNWLQIWIQYSKIILNLSAKKILLYSVINTSNTDCEIEKFIFNTVDIKTTYDGIS